jgi:hypothetical protein
MKIVEDKGEMRRGVVPVMPARNDVLDMERRKRKVLPLEEIVFTAISGPTTKNLRTAASISWGGRLARIARALACTIPTNSIALT